MNAGARRFGPVIVASVLIAAAMPASRNDATRLRASLRASSPSEMILFLPWMKARRRSLSLVRGRSITTSRSGGAAPSNGYDAIMRAKLVPLGAEFISASDALCNADGCLARIGDKASDISASDQVHLTEKGSVFLVRSIIDQVLDRRTPQSPNESQ
jgi:hypothetical protein